LPQSARLALRIMCAASLHAFIVGHHMRRSILALILSAGLALLLLSVAISKPSSTPAFELPSTPRAFRTNVSIRPGDDWSLPRWVSVSSDAGIYLGGVSDHIPTNVPIQQISLIQASWKNLEPADGTFSWSSIDGEIANNPGRYFWLRIYNTATTDVPSWLPREYPDLKTRPWFYNPTPHDRPGPGSGPQSFYYPWDANFDAKFKAFLSAFRQHYAVRNPSLLARIKFMYAPGAWNWDEYQVWPDKRSNGISPTAYVTWFDGLMDAYKAALCGDGRKLVYTGAGHAEWANNNGVWRQAINTAAGGNVHTDYVITHDGGGAREGITEAFNLFGAEPSWGSATQVVNGVKYVVTDDTHPLIAATDRYFGTENECYGDCGSGNAMDYYNVKMSFLVMLKLRMNWVFTCYQCYRTAPAMIDWSFKEMGKHYYDAPDAWTDLRQWTDINDGQTLNNWERWLYQRDQPGDGITVPTDPIVSIWSLQGPRYDEARRTDHANGSDYIYFGVADKFLHGDSHAIQLKVTYLDDNTSAWWVEYAIPGGNAYQATAVVRDTGNGAWKTATFAIPNADIQHREKGGMDFRIYNGGRHDLTVRFVRLVKMSPLARDVGIRRKNAG